jgi:hypothetical protein
MASSLTISQETITAVASANSYFTGIDITKQGNIQAETGAEDVRVCYNLLTWPSAPIDTSVVPTAQQCGMFGGFSAGVTISNSAAAFQVRRNSTLQYTDAKLQTPITTNFNNPITEGDSRWVVYFPTEDGPVGAFAHQYTTTDPNDVNAGNNITELLALTGRIPYFTGTAGPINMNGTALQDLYGQFGIFSRGCLVTWETSGTNGDAVMVGPSL